MLSGLAKLKKIKGKIVADIYCWYLGWVGGVPIPPCTHARLPQGSGLRHGKFKKLNGALQNIQIQIQKNPIYQILTRRAYGMMDIYIYI